MASQQTKILVLLLASLLMVTTVIAQTKRKRTPVKNAAPAPAAQPASDTSATPTPQAAPTKRNERPISSATANISPSRLENAAVNHYRYEFSQPEFVISKIVIEHDDAGKGTISFKRRESEEEISDPIVVSEAALARINAAYSALNFLDSHEDYQYERDYSHLGNAVYTLRRAGKQRSAKFNYTQNKDAKTLADEYRKIGQQYIWVFDITLARDSQPLEAPRLLDSLDMMLRRDEISDPAQLKDLLTALSDDERLPLIARNHSQRIIKQIEKVKK